MLKMREMSHQKQNVLQTEPVSRWHLHHKTRRASTPLELYAPGPAAAVHTRAHLCAWCARARMLGCVAHSPQFKMINLYDLLIFSGS